MIRYKCRISDSQGKISQVIKNAPSKESLIKEINDQSLYLISYWEVKKKNRKRFSKRVILDFTETMALMLSSGLSIKDALTVSDGELVSEISESLKKGISFPEALNEMEADFSPIYRGMVKIGDQTGSMDDIFSKLSKYLIDDKLMREKIQGALMYPVLVLTVLFLGMFALFLFILPGIKETFATDTLDIVFTRFQLIMLLVFIPFVLLFFLGLFIGIGSKTESKTRDIADSLKLKIPLLGKISSIRSTLNIMFSLEVLTTSGFPLESALEESSTVLTNRLLSAALKRIRASIIGGEKLSFAFKREKVFPHRIAQWIAVGEASGSVSKVFSQLRTYYQSELDKITSRIMLLVEPILIAFVGALMMLFVLLFVVPLFSVFGGIT